MTTYTIGAHTTERIPFTEYNTPRAIMKCVQNIMATRKGTVPLYMDLGTDHSYVDLPVQDAKIRMIAPLREAIEEWEPRVTVVQISSKTGGAMSEQLLPCAEVTINGNT